MCVTMAVNSTSAERLGPQKGHFGLQPCTCGLNTKSRMSVFTIEQDKLRARLDSRWCFARMFHAVGITAIKRRY